MKLSPLVTILSVTDAAGKWSDQNLVGKKDADSFLTSDALSREGTSKQPFKINKRKAKI